MLDSFGDLLLQFAQSVDSLNDKDFDELRDTVGDYTQDVLKISATRFMVASRDSTTNSRRLVPLRHARRGRFQSLPIKTKDGCYSGHCAYSFDNNKRLWVLSGDENPNLVEATSYQDLWSDSMDLPTYRPIEQDEIKTSIIIPTTDEIGDVFGVLNFETSELLDITRAAKDELKKIAQALGLSYILLQNTRSRRLNTEAALKELQAMQRRSWPKLTKPKVFLASPASGDDKIIETIQSLFNENEFRHKYDLIYWKDMNQPGNINDHLLSILGTCRYGICYFSEPHPDAENTYQDNDNVVFEAGMLHGRTNTISSRPVAWIPIREKNSGDAPFDFRNERTIEVPRSDEGELDTNQFREQLQRLVRLLDTPDRD